MASKPSFRRAILDDNIDSWGLAGMKAFALGMCGTLISMVGLLISSDVTKEEGQSGKAVSEAQVARYEAEIQSLKYQETVLQSFEALSGIQANTQELKKMAGDVLTPAVQQALKDKSQRGRNEFNQSVQALSYRIVADRNLSEKAFENVVDHMIKRLDAPVPSYLASDKDVRLVDGWRLRECQTALPATAAAADISMCARSEEQRLSIDALEVGAGAGLSLMLVGPLMGYRRQKKEYKSALEREEQWKKERAERDRAEALRLQNSTRDNTGQSGATPEATTPATKSHRLRF